MKSRTELILNIALITALMAMAGAARAQSPQINAVYPPGGLLGSKVTARLEGANLIGGTSIMVSGQGVAAQMGAGKDGNTLPLTLDIAKNADPGPHEIRLLTPKGLSNPGYVWVGILPEMAETEPNDQPEKAMKLSNLPVTVYGRADNPEDVDWYSVEASAGDTYVIEMCANRIYSPIDSFVELRDSAGRLLATGTEGYDRDPRVIYTFKKPGTYRIQVRDTLYRGGQGYVYRMSVGKIPAVTSVFPPGGKRGEKLDIAVQGVNLGGTSSLSIMIPSELPHSYPWYIVPQTANGPALPISINGDSYSQSSRTTPTSIAAPLGITPPTTVNARLDNGKQADYYSIPCTQGTTVNIAYHAREIGSRLDGFLRVLDRTGKELLNTEDQIGRDPRVSFTPPATDTYKIEVTGLDGRGGPDYYYRLSVGSPDGPDFRLTANTDQINLGKGQTILVTVNVSRQGKVGDIPIRVEGVPAGVAVSPLIIPADKPSGNITFTAPANAAAAASSIRIIGEATVGGAKLVRQAVPIASLPRPGEGVVVPRRVAFQGVSTNETVPLFALSFDQNEVALTPGQTAMVKIKVARKPGDNNANPAIGLSIADLPPGVTSETPAIAEKAAEAIIKLTASKDAKPVSQIAIVTGKLGENSQPAPALLIRVNSK